MQYQTGRVLVMQGGIAYNNGRFQDLGVKKMKIDEKLRQMWNRIGGPQKTAWLSCMVIGYLMHLYAFTNLIPNSDGLSRMYDAQQMTISGRWFLHYASMFHEYTQMPAAIGLLSLLFVACASMFVVDLLGIESKVFAGLTGAVMAAFPCLGYTFLYMFTASAYSFAILLAVVSVWLAWRRSKGGFAVGALCLALSMGIYQAYVTVAIALTLLVLLRETMQPQATFKETFHRGLYMIGYLAAGAVLYYAVLMVFLKVKNLELLSYLGMDAANSGYPFAQLPHLIATAYKQVFAFFFMSGAENAFGNAVMIVLDLAAVLLGIRCFAVYVSVKKMYTERWHIIGAAAMVLLLPLGMNFGQVMSPYSVPTPIMKYAFVTAYFLPLMLASYLDSVELRRRKKRKCAVTVTALWMAGVLLFCLDTNNLLYMATTQAHRATESYMTRLMTRIEDCEDYEPGMDVAIIGGIPAEQITCEIEGFDRVIHYSAPTDTVLERNKHLYYYLQDWLNVPVHELSEDTMISIAESEAFAEMPLYPAKGSVAMIDDCIVVKMQETYTPKQDFELAYENRR